MHQQIPISGQKWITFSSLGRKGILTDYIPSLNFRVEKEERWFLQAEFRFGAPQHTKQFTYNQKIITDTASQTADITSFTLKKTFYHQLPLTFNYYVRPGWAMGAGFVWNRFHSAVSEREIFRRNLVTQNDSLISKSIIKVKSDSSLVKSWWQLVFQTQYQRKQISVGIRYAAGLQPYIEYSVPGIQNQKERNSSLQIFLRYEFWKSKQE